MEEYEPDIKHIQSMTLSSPVENLQVFNPLFRSFLSPETMQNPGATLKTEYEMIHLNLIRATHPPNTYHKRPVHIKYAPLLDPLRYMIGKYDNQPEMDKHVCFADDYSVHPTKYKDLNNASYVDAFFCFLSSRLLHGYGLQNAIDFYGCFSGVQQGFSIDILDDYEYLNDYSGFLRKLKSGEVVCPEFALLQQLHSIGGSSQNSSRCVKKRICLEEDVVLDDVLSSTVLLDDPLVFPTGGDTEDTGGMVLEYEKEPIENEKSDDASLNDDDDDDDDDASLIETESASLNDDDGESNVSSDLEGDNRVIHDASLDDASLDDDETELDDDASLNGDDDASLNEKMMAVIKNFPVQLICLEKCEGTLDAIFCQEEINSDVCMAYAFQIVATLSAYQKAYSMTHNDLHTNNIVYCSTPHKYLYYRLFGKSYRVPTHGKILKIIDFGRSVYRFQDRKMVSDGFSPTGDANTQYNTEPYYNPNQPRIEENPSFDLCRLGCSIYDFVFDDQTRRRTPVKKMDAFQKMIHRWCLDDKGKSVLYKKNGEERFPHFKLYKMIARTVHQHTPENQMSDFTMFLIENENETEIHHDETGDSPRIDIDRIPVLYEC
jgi:hypothetical protein